MFEEIEFLYKMVEREVFRIISEFLSYFENLVEVGDEELEWYYFFRLYNYF